MKISPLQCCQKIIKSRHIIKNGCLTHTMEMQACVVFTCVFYWSARLGETCLARTDTHWRPSCQAHGGPFILLLPRLPFPLLALSLWVSSQRERHLFLSWFHSSWHQVWRCMSLPLQQCFRRRSLWCWSWVWLGVEKSVMTRVCCRQSTKLFTPGCHFNNVF